MALRLGELVGFLRLDGRQFDRDLRGAEDRFRGTGSVIGGIAGTLAGTLAGVGAAAFLKGAISSASDLSETLSKSRVVFGDQAAAVEAWSAKSDTAFGLSQQAALAATGQFGDMFHQLGFTQTAAAGMSESLVQTAADLGSFHNVDPSDVLNRVGGALRGEYDSLQQLIPNINAARVEQEALRVTHKKSAADLTAAEKATAVLAIVQKDGASAAGDFARTSGGLANQQRIMSAQVENAKAKIGTALLPAMAALAGYITGTVIPAVYRLATFLRENAGTIRTVAKVIAAVLLPILVAWGAAAVVAAALNVFAWIAAALASVSSAETQALSAAQVAFRWVVMGIRAAASAAVVVAGWVLMGAQSLLNAARMAAAWLIALGPIGIVIALVALVVGYIITHWSQVRAATVAAWNAVSGAVKTAALAVWAAIRSLAAIPGIVGGYFLAAGRAIASAVRTAVGFVRDLLVAGIKLQIAALSTLGSTIGGYFLTAASAVADAIGTLVGYVAGIPGRVLGALGNLGSLLYDAGADIIRGLIDGITSKIAAVKDTLGNLTSSLTSWKGPPSTDAAILRPAGRLLIGGFMAGIDDRLGDLRGQLGGLTAALPGMASSGGTVVNKTLNYYSSGSPLGAEQDLYDAAGRARMVGW